MYGCELRDRHDVVVVESSDAAAACSSSCCKRKNETKKFEPKIWRETTVRENLAMAPTTDHRRIKRY